MSRKILKFGLIMKILLPLILCLMALTSCNQQIIDFNLKFDRAYVKIGDEWKDIEVKMWTDYEDGEQIQLTLKDGTVILVHSANCILYNGNLP